MATAPDSALQPPDQTPASETDSWSSTDFKIIQFSYKWVIRKFPIHYTNSQVKFLDSPVFTSGRPDDLCRWRLRVYYREPNAQHRHSVKIGLTLVEGATAKKPILVSVRMGLTMMDKTQDRHNQKKYVHEVNQRSIHTLSEIISSFLAETNYLLAESNGILCNGNLTVFCDVKVYMINDIVHVNGSRVTPYTEVFELNCFANLSHEFGSLLQEGLCCDVTIVAAGEEFKAHKGILSARSQVFRAMFEHNMEENAKNQVTIEGHRADVVREMLTYIYTGSVPNLKKMTEPLFSIADMYALEELKLLCERELAKRLSIQNAVETLVLADQYSAVNLRGVCIDFIAANAQEVMDNPGWPKLAQHHELMTGVMRKLVANPLPLPVSKTAGSTA